MYDSPEDVLRACVDRLGGAKSVGCRLKPELSDRPDIAARWVLDRLNDERRERMSLQQAVTVLRWAGAAGWHEGMTHWNRLCGYGPSTPLAPEAEVADLQRKLADTITQQRRLFAQMQAAGLKVGEFA